MDVGIGEGDTRRNVHDMHKDSLPDWHIGLALFVSNYLLVCGTLSRMLNMFI